MIIWRDGAYLSADEARHALDDRGALLGDGVFDTALIWNGRPVFAGDHVNRLFDHAARIGLTMPLEKPALLAVWREMAGKVEAETGVLRTSLSRGPCPRGLAPPTDPLPSLLITAKAAGVPTGPVKAHIVSIRRNEGSPASNMKTMSYMDNILARNEAAAAGADEAVMLNNQGHAACASAANIFVRTADGLITPPLSDGVLDGIVRRKMMRLCAEAGPALREDHISEDLLRRHPVFLTNSLIGLRPVSHMNGVALPACSGIEDLQRRYAALVQASE